MDTVTFLADLDELNARARVALTGGVPDLDVVRWGTAEWWAQLAPGGVWHRLMGWATTRDNALLIATCQPIVTWSGVTVTSARPARICSRCCQDAPAR